MDALRNQYMLGLGEFDTQGFADNPDEFLCYTFFIFATFCTQIVFLNLLIAIMGNTFEFVIDRKSQYALQTKLSIMSEYYYVLSNKTNAQQDCKNYLFIVRPKVDKHKDEREDWEGSFNNLRQILDQKITQLERNFELNLQKQSENQIEKIENLRRTIET